MIRYFTILLLMLSFSVTEVFSIPVLRIASAVDTNVTGGTLTGVTLSGKVGTSFPNGQPLILGGDPSRAYTWTGLNFYPEDVFFPERIIMGSQPTEIYPLADTMAYFRIYPDGTNYARNLEMYLLNDKNDPEVSTTYGIFNVNSQRGTYNTASSNIYGFTNEAIFNGNINDSAPANNTLKNLISIYTFTRIGKDNFPGGTGIESASIIDKMWSIFAENQVDGINAYNHTVNSLRGIYISNPKAGTGNLSIVNGGGIEVATIPVWGGTMTTGFGIWLNPQTNFINNYGLVLSGNGAGADIVFGPNQENKISRNAVTGETIFTGTSGIVPPSFAFVAAPATCIPGAIIKESDSDTCAGAGGNGALCVCNNTGNGWVLLVNY